VTSASVATSGVIGWVGLVVPHLARAMLGPDFPRFIPTAALLGGGYLLFIDTIARDSVVLMGRTAHGNLFSPPSTRDRMVAARVLEQFGIAHLAPRAYTMISGGERQLVLLARALAQEPQFVVLDEPTGNLDFGNQGKVMREIRELAGAGHGILFTTHDPNHALRAADRAYLLRQGERVAEGAVGAVLTRERLEDLYGASVEKLTDAATGHAAFLPG
jgi:iron complex transport system ATP-binding protein